MWVSPKFGTHIPHSVSQAASLTSPLRQTFGLPPPPKGGGCQIVQTDQPLPPGEVPRKARRRGHSAAKKRFPPYSRNRFRLCKHNHISLLTYKTDACSEVFSLLHSGFTAAGSAHCVGTISSPTVAATMATHRQTVASYARGRLRRTDLPRYATTGTVAFNFYAKIAFSASARSVFSQETPKSSRPI